MYCRVKGIQCSMGAAKAPQVVRDFHRRLLQSSSSITILQHRRMGLIGMEWGQLIWTVLNQFWQRNQVHFSQALTLNTY
jgi:hypothetical protein